MNSYDCKTFAEELPELVLTEGALPSAAASAHMQVCPPCSDEYLSFQSTFQVLDTWTVPPPTAYFDQKMAVRLREEQAAPAMGWFERLTTSLSFNTGRTFRPILAGALSLMMAVGGGSLYMLNQNSTQTPAAVEPASATVNDLQIFDRNEQAFDQMDLIDQDAHSAPADTQQQAPATVPES